MSYTIPVGRVEVTRTIDGANESLEGKIREAHPLDPTPVNRFHLPQEGTKNETMRLLRILLHVCQ